VTSVDRLLAVASDALEQGEVRGLPGGRAGAGLAELLAARNGFVAFESALLVRGGGDGSLGLRAWNDDAAWRYAYAGMADGLYFFAEDVFGYQFAIAGDEVVRFDPEVGESSAFAPTIEAWAGLLLDDVENLTGWPLARDWQSARGPLRLGRRLIPTIPFVLGGAFTVENVHQLDDYHGMRLRGDIAVQLKDVPDGAQVEYVVD
jgi:hypothetical protein